MPWTTRRLVFGPEREFIHHLGPVVAIWDMDVAEMQRASQALDAGPRIKFYLTAAEAEAAQFQGKGEGAEQIGSALLFVDPELDEETEDAVEEAELCLADL